MSNNPTSNESAQRIWEKQGYQSVYHYAQAIAGLSFNVIQNGENQKCHAQQKISIELDDEMQQLFLKLKQKYGDKISNKEALF